MDLLAICGGNRSSGSLQGPIASIDAVAGCLDDWIDEGNPVRGVDVFVDGFNLAQLGFDGVVPEATGRPSYHPSALLKLYICGYLNRVQSSRRLEREAGRNMEVIGLRPLTLDDKTIADFRKDDGPAIRQVRAQLRERGAVSASSARPTCPRCNGDQYGDRCNRRLTLTY